MNMNLDKFNSLPAHLQKLLVDTQLEMEPWMLEHFPAVEQAQLQKNNDLGVEFIEFTGEDAEWYLDAAFNSEWDELFNKVPDIAAIIRPMIDR